MNEQLPIWQLISEATILVQAVMLLLMLASIISWVMIFQRAAVYRRARKQLLDFEDEFWSGICDLGYTRL